MCYHQPEHESAENSGEESTPVITDGKVDGSYFNAEQYTCCNSIKSSAIETG